VLGYSNSEYHENPTVLRIIHKITTSCSNASQTFFDLRAKRALGRFGIDFSACCFGITCVMLTTEGLWRGIAEGLVFTL